MTPNTRSDGTHGVVTAAFRNWEDAERAYRSIIDRAGYTDDDVSVIMSDDTRKEFLKSGYKETEVGSKAAEGAGLGAAIGGTIGGVAGAIAAAAAPVVFPGIGLVLSGPLAAALAGAGAGGAGGTLLGGLIGAGIPEKHAQRYESHLKEGNIVLAVDAHNASDAEYFEDQFRKHNGDNIYR